MVPRHCVLAEDSATIIHCLSIVCFVFFRNPNKPSPVKMFWPAFNEKEQQYLHITHEMTSESVKSHFFSREFSLWRTIIPNIFKTLDSQKKRTVSETCDRDGSCPP